VEEERGDAMGWSCTTRGLGPFLLLVRAPSVAFMRKKRKERREKKGRKGRKKKKRRKMGNFSKLGYFWEEK
jgi:hypothetical protein